MMRTTLTLDDDVAAQLDQAMRASGRSFKQTVNEALREGLARRRESAEVEPFVVRARELGRVPGLDYSHLGELLDASEGPEHR